jgi:phosphoribosylformimino-5-aminoimidazole carboxamide ribotide isomerase
MRIIPVLDLKAGQVVHAIAGRRHEYRPVVSQLTASSRPGQVARAFQEQLGLTECYLADLDAIAGSAPNLPAYAVVQGQGLRLWVDAGIQRPEQAAVLVDAGVEGIVVGLETVAGPQELAEICRQLGPDRLLFSLDLKEGRPLAATGTWGDEPWSIASQAVETGVRRLIVLDLARVGGGGGTGTEALCRRLVTTYPELEICAGGGVGSRNDLLRLRDAGVHAALVASALHDGRLRPADWRDL